MGEIYKASHGDFNIEFGGENEIEASTLIGAMDEVIRSIELIKSKVEPGTNIKIKIASFEIGCFIVNLKTIVDNLTGMFSTNSIGVATNIITILIGTIEIKKHLKGKKHKEISCIGEDVIIINRDNETLTKNKVIADTYFHDSRIDQSITNMVNIVNINGNRENLVIRQNDKNIVEIRRENFEQMSEQVITEEDMIVQTMSNTIEVDLLLKKPDLLGKSKWGFILDKNIEVTIEDEEWIKKIHSGDISLCAGVKIPVRLFIETDLDKDNRPIATRYTILKVTGDVIEPNKENMEQLRLE